MARIKSALEIALERTEGVKGAQDDIDQFEAKQQGKRAANTFLAQPGVSLDAAISAWSAESQESFKEGIIEVLTAQVSLPATPEDEARIERIGKGLQSVIPGSSFKGLCTQLQQIVGQYLDEASRYGDAIQRQYAPKLKQKEEDLSRRHGRSVKIDPFQDPEFIAFYNQHMNTLKHTYEPYITQFREQVRIRAGQPAGNSGEGRA